LVRLLVLLTFVVLTGCPGTPTTTALTPVTGILVRADALVSGVGCGTRDDQIYRYAAVITQRDPNDASKEVTQRDPNAGGIGAVFDCFADGAFRQLLPGTDGSLSFIVEIYAFSFAAYNTQNASGRLDHDATDWDALQAYEPTYRTTCSATQQENVEVLAVCGPLQKGQTTSFRVDTTHFATSLGVDLQCGQAYSTVQGTFTNGSTKGDLPSVTCPSAILVSSAQAPATYDLDLRLLDGETPPNNVATVHCRATTAKRAQVVAVCDPAQE
jgi:hypothetical protein